MSAEPIGSKPECRPLRPSKPKGEIADPAARAASARLAASGLTARFGRVWRTFHFVHEELSTHGRYRGTFTILGITASALGKPETEVTGWERKDTLDDLATLEELGVLWYWPATGRGHGRWAMVEFPPVDERHPVTGGSSGMNDTLSRENDTLSRRERHPVNPVTPKVSPKDNPPPAPTSADTFTPERDKPSGKKKQIPDDVSGFFDVVRGRVGIELEPTSTLVEEIRARMGKGFSARHVGGEVEAGTWPGTFRESPEAVAISRLRKLGGAR